MNKKVLDFVNKLEGYKTAIKQLHWDAKNMSQHELCDDIAESIAEFQDTVSEVEQSITGKLKVNSLKPTEYKIKDLKSFVEDVLDATNNFYKEVKDMGDTYVGMASDCESFLSDMQRKLYLVNFTLKEELKERLKAKINESMPKNLANHDEVDKFMGRKPKSIKARINQVYRIVKKYGIDSKVYHDENWQAISDYYRAISSLGCEVEMKPCASLSNADSMESDGGYTDYDPYTFYQTVEYKDPYAEFRIAKSFGNFVFELPEDVTDEKYAEDIFVVASSELQLFGDLSAYNVDDFGGYFVVYK